MPQCNWIIYAYILWAPLFCCVPLNCRFISRLPVVTVINERVLNVTAHRSEFTCVKECSVTEESTAVADDLTGHSVGIYELSRWR